jgi:type II restriction/modification system DNA methylase subunit YeeA
MNKSALKKFATEARKELREKVKIKALQLGITEDAIKEETVQSSDSVFIDGRQLTKEEQRQRNKLIDRIKLKGFNQVIEEVAYTWFNRFAALRFMEVHNYLPTKVRVLSSTHEGSYEPDIMKEALNINLDIDKELVYELKVSTENDATDKLYKHLILAQCDALAPILPFMFGKTYDYTIILFPDGLLSEGSFLRRMTDTDIIPESDWDDVEIIGWLYQYYIAEENERVIKAKKRYKKEEIPYATQLFTPDWIVRYMVQNALGRYWVESHPEHRDLISNWEFYLENPNPEPDFEEKLAPYLNKDMKVEEIKCFDPAMGSGHILVYMFDVLYEIYLKCGYMDREIPKLIIENNLYGLDIDDRAYQLACFSVIMKAQQYNSRFLRNLERQVRETGEYIKLNLASIQETNGFGKEEIEYIAGESSGEKFEKVKRFIEQFENAKIFGSLTEINEFDEEFLIKREQEIIKNPVRDIALQAAKVKVDDILENLIKQTRIMNQMYDVLVTNPPYAGNKYLNPVLSQYFQDYYKDYKTDMFSVFMVYCMKQVQENGHLAFVTPYVWMSISSYFKLRKLIVDNKSISSLIQLEYNAFEVAVVPVCTFTLRNYSVDVHGNYIRLSDFKGIESQPIKTLEAIKDPTVSYRYEVITKNFSKIPDYPIAYWVDEKVINSFDGKKVSDYGEAKQGLATADNNRFVRLWTEVDINNIGFDISNRDEAIKSGLKWFPYNKGGGYRKWFGNSLFVVNWKNDGFEIKNNVDENGKQKSRPQNKDYYFKRCLSWGKVSNIQISFRYIPQGHIFDVAGCSLFLSDSNLYYFLGVLNSKVVNEMLGFMSPTMNYEVGQVSNIPIIVSEDKKNIIEELVKKAIEISKNEWDMSELSWHFQKHPFIKKDVALIKDALFKVIHIIDDNINTLMDIEDKINSHVYDIYDRDSNKRCTVNRDEVALRDKDEARDIKSFISYAVGCMFGRYSLDEEGLIYAGGEFDINRYQTFKPDKDNVLPIVANAYFEDDIVSRFVEFVKVTFGSETLNENLEFIAETLGMKNNETPKETIRRYFLNDFFKDHVQTYKKRPIYWLFTSGKQKAFNALIYMHRYDKTTLARIRTDYLHVLQNRLDAQRQSLIDIVNSDESVKEKKRVEKELKKIEKQIAELKEYDEVLHHMADMQIEIDLDDGVAVNYEKFKGLVAKI